jgi:hypothetical protein
MGAMFSAMLRYNARFGKGGAIFPEIPLQNSVALR